MIATIHYSTFNLAIVERLTLGARDHAERFLFGVDPLDRFALLVEREDWLPAQPNTVRDGAHPAFAGARADKIALELGQAAEHREHEAAVRRFSHGLLDFCTIFGGPIRIDCLRPATLRGR